MRPMNYRNGLFVAWETYQRRAELLAPRLGAELVYFPNRMPSRALRPLDYVAKSWGTRRAIRAQSPDFVVAQAPPHFTMLPPWFEGVPYVLDVHNGLFQSRWASLPLVRTALRRAACVLVHNDEILEIAQHMHPDIDFVVLPDPIESIRFDGLEREPKQVLFVCSFDSDEPLDVIVETVEMASEFEFVITANAAKLPAPLRGRLESCANARLTGHLSTEAYQRVLCSSRAAISLTETEATQQSGACEALSSDTPLVTSRTTLNERLFGGWATLVDNEASSVVHALREFEPRRLDFSDARAQWDEQVRAQLGVVLQRVPSAA